MSEAEGRVLATLVSVFFNFGSDERSSLTAPDGGMFGFDLIKKCGGCVVSVEEKKMKRTKTNTE